MSRQKFGRYEIKKELGQGGMATVYLAHDPRVMRDVALKVLPHQYINNSDFQARFGREKRTSAALEHPAIVPVYDFGEEEGQPFIVMRYMAGGSLAERLPKGNLSLAEATAVLRRIGAALDEAHSKGIFHRDLKPGNILFDQSDNAYLADFGIAKISEAMTNLTGSSLIGTPAYMSPEQVKGEGIDCRSDIYALGIILYEMLSGKQPYEATTPWGVLSKHVNDPLPSILEKAADLPPQIEMVLLRATAKDVRDRFQTAGELATAVADITQKRSSFALPTIPTITPLSETTTTPAADLTQIAPSDNLPESESSPTIAEPTAIAQETELIVPDSAPPLTETAAVETEFETSIPLALSEQDLAETVTDAPILQPASRPKWVWVAGIFTLIFLLFIARAIRRSQATPLATETETVASFIQTKWDEGFRITDLSYGRGGWALMMAEESPYGRQTWRTFADFPGDFIESKWDEGFRVTHLTYGQRRWAVIMAEGSPYGRQTWQTLDDLADGYIEERWTEGFRVTSLTYGDSAWAIVMSQASPYGRQTWRAFADFPGEFIEEKWAEGYRVTSLAYGERQWAIVMSQASPYGPQTWRTFTDFPGDYIEEQWAAGYRVTSLTYGDGVWALIMSQESAYGRQAWWKASEFE